jgi:branched-chain amino acid transport system permease protein
MPVPPFRVLGFAIVGERMWYWVTGGMLLLSVWLALNLIDSPVGRALVGRKVGDTATLETPRGARSLKVLRITTA